MRLGLVDRQIPVRRGFVDDARMLRIGQANPVLRVQGLLVKAGIEPRQKTHRQGSKLAAPFSLPTRTPLSAQCCAKASAKLVVASSLFKKLDRSAARGIGSLLIPWFRLWSRAEQGQRSGR